MAGSKERERSEGSFLDQPCKMGQSLQRVLLIIKSNTLSFLTVETMGSKLSEKAQIEKSVNEGVAMFQNKLYLQRKVEGCVRPTDCSLHTPDLV